MDRLYQCYSCTYATDIKYCYQTHLKSKRHLKNMVASQPNHSEVDIATIRPDSLENIQAPEYKYSCTKCNKPYNHRSSLYYHTKRCTAVPHRVPRSVATEPTQEEDEEPTLEPRQLIDREPTNQELYDILMKLVNKETVPTNVNNYRQINNVTVNMFLEEKYAHATNLTDVIRTLPIERRYFGRLMANPAEYVSQNTQLLMNEIQKLPLEKRPIHCISINDESTNTTDSVHIRSNDSWVNEDDKDILFGIMKLTNGYCVDDNSMSGTMKEWDTILFNKIDLIYADHPHLKTKIKKIFMDISCDSMKKVKLVKCILRAIKQQSETLKQEIAMYAELLESENEYETPLQDTPL